jgi:phosphoribosylformylglycinamidine synthase
VTPGGDAGVIRVEDGRGLAMTADVTPRYCEADPFEGGKQAVAEAWRNLTATGATPLADHRQPELRQSREARDHGPVRRLPSKASARPAAALDFPVVSGNVSLYNETNGIAILPTDHRRRRRHGRCHQARRRLQGRERGDPDRRDHGLARPVAYLATVCGREEGARRRSISDRTPQRRFRARADPRARSRPATTCRMAALPALAEMAMAKGIGATIDAAGGPFHAALFGEDQARYV